MSMAQQTAVQKTEVEQLHEDATTPEVSVDARVGGVRGATALHEELDAAADSARATGFKCAHPKCGLVHGHATNKHRTGDSFDMSHSEAAQMEANPNCHCGLNGVARRSDVPSAPSPSEANSKAPIPDQMARHLDS